MIKTQIFNFSFLQYDGKKVKSNKVSLKGKIHTHMYTPCKGRKYVCFSPGQ